MKLNEVENVSWNEEQIGSTLSDRISSLWLEKLRLHEDRPQWVKPTKPIVSFTNEPIQGVPV